MFKSFLQVVSLHSTLRNSYYKVLPIPCWHRRSSQQTCREFFSLWCRSTGLIASCWCSSLNSNAAPISASDHPCPTSHVPSHNPTTLSRMSSTPSGTHFLLVSGYPSSARIRVEIVECSLISSDSVLWIMATSVSSSWTVE